MDKLVALTGIALLFLCVDTASPAVWIEYQKPQPGKALFCTDKIEGKKRVGEIWQDPEHCVQKRCLTDSQGTALISHAGCGAIAAEPPCRVVPPTTMNSNYPDCCPKVEC